MSLFVSPHNSQMSVNTSSFEPGACGNLEQVYEVLPDAKSQGLTNNVKTALCSKNIKQLSADASAHGRQNAIHEGRR